MGDALLLAALEEGERLSVLSAAQDEAAEEDYRRRRDVAVAQRVTVGRLIELLSACDPESLVLLSGSDEESYVAGGDNFARSVRSYGRDVVISSEVTGR